MTRAHTVAHLDAVCHLARHADWLTTAAHQLAAQIDTLSGLTAEQRCDLRMLPMAMLAKAQEMTGDRT